MNRDNRLGDWSICASNKDELTVIVFGPDGAIGVGAVGGGLFVLG